MNEISLKPNSNKCVKKIVKLLKIEILKSLRTKLMNLCVIKAAGKMIILINKYTLKYLSLCTKTKSLCCFQTWNLQVFRPMPVAQEFGNISSFSMG